MIFAITIVKKCNAEDRNSKKNVMQKIAIVKNVMQKIAIVKKM